VYSTPRTERLHGKIAKHTGLPVSKSGHADGWYSDTDNSPSSFACKRLANESDGGDDQDAKIVHSIWVLTTAWKRREKPEEKWEGGHAEGVVEVLDFP